MHAKNYIWVWIISLSFYMGTSCACLTMSVPGQQLDRWIKKEHSRFKVLTWARTSREHEIRSHSTCLQSDSNKLYLLLHPDLWRHTWTVLWHEGAVQSWRWLPKDKLFVPWGFCWPRILFCWNFFASFGFKGNFLFYLWTFVRCVVAFYCWTSFGIRVSSRKNIFRAWLFWNFCPGEANLVCLAASAYWYLTSTT